MRSKLRARVGRVWGAVILAGTLSLLAPLAQAGPATSAGRFGEWGVDLKSGDPAVRPGDSFFDHANGRWLARAVIPPDGSGAGVDFELSLDAQIQVVTIIASFGAEEPAGSDRAKVRDLYASFMDVSRINKLDVQPLRPALKRIAAAPDHRALAAWMGHTSSAFGGSMFGAGVVEDVGRPGQYALIAAQGGMWMPTRDYYLSPDFAAQKTAYEAYVVRALTMAGWPDPTGAARDILAMETRVAQVSWSVTEQQDTVAAYNPMSVAELEALAPGFAWRDWLAGQGLSAADRIVVREKSAFPKIAAIYAETPLPTLKAWAAFTLVDQASSYLSKRFVDSRFAFQDQALHGQQQQTLRIGEAIELINDRLGEAVGREYVARYFPARSKAKMEGMVDDLKAAMGARLQRADWMAPATKAAALDKLAKMRVMVGYPSRWRDYSALSVDAGDLYGNMERSNAFEWATLIGRLGKPIDREEWGLTPQTLNAYNNPAQNVVVFPAVLLQPPYFDPEADMAVNYGAIGGVIGHEITHGFDSDGRKFDADGMLRDWWTAADAARFNAEAAKLAAQYDGYEGAPGAFVNGTLTVGEDIADMGGLLLALEAYHKALGGKPAPVIDGLSGDQRLFLAWAQMWRSKQRDDVTRAQMASDSHPPARFRVDGPTRNIDAWYAAFEVSPQDRYYLKPEDRVRIW